MELQSERRPISVAELRKRLDDLDDDRWVYVHVSRAGVTVTAETHGARPTDEQSTSVTLLMSDAPIQVTANATRAL